MHLSGLHWTANWEYPNRFIFVTMEIIEVPFMQFKFWYNTYHNWYISKRKAFLTVFNVTRHEACVQHTFSGKISYGCSLFTRNYKYFIYFLEKIKIVFTCSLIQLQNIFWQFESPQQVLLPLLRNVCVGEQIYFTLCIDCISCTS